MSTLTEYEYRPPNVRAIRWDGREETAATILKAAPLNSEFRVHIHKTSNFEHPEGFTKQVALFFGPHQFAVNRGDYIVFEPNGEVHLAEKDDFEYHYQKYAGNSNDTTIAMETPAVPVGWAAEVTRPITTAEEVQKIADLAKTLPIQPHVPATLEDEDYSAPEHPPIDVDKYNELRINTGYRTQPATTAEPIQPIPANTAAEFAAAIQRITKP
jgi:hypothetical protein